MTGPARPVDPVLNWDEPSILLEMSAFLLPHGYAYSSSGGASPPNIGHEATAASEAAAERLWAACEGIGTACFGNKRRREPPDVGPLEARACLHMLRPGELPLSLNTDVSIP